MHSFSFIDAVGIVGAVLILIGFYRTSIGRWTSKSFWYELDNLLGAVLLVVYQLHYHAIISVMVNAIWAIVAFRGLTSFAERYKVDLKGIHRIPRPRAPKRQSTKKRHPSRRTS